MRVVFPAVRRTADEFSWRPRGVLRRADPARTTRSRATLWSVAGHAIPGSPGHIRCVVDDVWFDRAQCVLAPRVRAVSYPATESTSLRGSTALVARSAPSAPTTTAIDRAMNEGASSARARPFSAPREIVYQEYRKVNYEISTNQEAKLPHAELRCSYCGCVRSAANTHTGLGWMDCTVYIVSSRVRGTPHPTSGLRSGSSRRKSRVYPVIYREQQETSRCGGSAAGILHSRTMKS